MRIIEDDAAMERLFPITAAEAKAAFGSGALFIERFLRKPRHVEVQFAGDRFGAAVHVGERDCSMQRRHQKIIEEAPAPGLSDDLRDRIRNAAARLVASTGYVTVGTCEFLVEGNEFFFLEVNPRIQVEHPVSELVTGIDLVQLQIRLAAGEPMPFAQHEVKLQGHAIEIRVNAEDPWKFTPSPGKITGYHAPGGPGVRVDSAVHEGATVQPYYDSLVAKLIVYAPTREAAINKLLGAMSEYVVEGIRTSMPLQKLLLTDPAFQKIQYHTRYIDEWLSKQG